MPEFAAVSDQGGPTEPHKDGPWRDGHEKPAGPWLHQLERSLILSESPGRRQGMSRSLDINHVKYEAIQHFVTICEAHLRCRPAAGLLQIMRQELREVRRVLIEDEETD